METREPVELTTMLTDNMKRLIRKYNAARKINSFFYKNSDSHEVYKEIRNSDPEKSYEHDRFEYVNIQNRIEKELAREVHDLFHGLECYVAPERGPGKNVASIKGTIEYHLTREYEERTLDNGVSFRREYEDETYSAPETIALWVKTDDKHATHLYTVNNIFIDIPEVSREELVGRGLGQG